MEANAREVSEAAGEVAGLRLRVAALEDALGRMEGEAEAARRREVALAETVGDLRVRGGKDREGAYRKATKGQGTRVQQRGGILRI